MGTLTNDGLSHMVTAQSDKILQGLDKKAGLSVTYGDMVNDRSLVISLTNISNNSNALLTPTLFFGAKLTIKKCF